MNRVEKSVALYYEPQSIGSVMGAHCGICWKFDPVAHACVEVAGTINGTRGICGLYVEGESVGDRLANTPGHKVSKEEAGYSENGPTHCGNCEYIVRRGIYVTSPCRKVEGLVDGRACCNLWSKAT